MQVFCYFFVFTFQYMCIIAMFRLCQRADFEVAEEQMNTKC